MAEMGELVDRAVGLPPGPELSATLAALSWEKVPNTRLVEVLQARDRQVAHEQAGYYAGLVEISHAVAVTDLPDAPATAQSRVDAVVRSQAQYDWASGEIAAGLVWTPTRADRELGFALALCERLKPVFTALEQGLIDLAKARVLVDYLDPATGEITDEQARQLCERYLPVAPGLTTKQLSDRLYRALLALDPDLRRRRYQRAVQQRRVALYLDPKTGTATLVGDGLPAEEAAAAAARLDRLAAACRRAGHPGTLGQISADVYLGMLNGAFYGLTEDEIVAQLLATRRADDDPDDADAAETASADTDTAQPDTTEIDEVDETGTGDQTSDESDGAEDSDGADESDDSNGADESDDSDSSADSRDDSAEDSGDGSGDGSDDDSAEDSADDDADDDADDSGVGVPDGAGTGPGSALVPADMPSTGPTCQPPTGQPPTGQPPAEQSPAEQRWAVERIGMREGIEVRAGLGTLAGQDDRPGDIPGLGPITAHTARAAATAQRRGAAWVFAITDPRGYLLLAGPLRRRPRNTGARPPAPPSRAGPPTPPAPPGSPAPPVRGGVVEVHLSLDELQRYVADPAMVDWHPLLAEIARAWANRDDLQARLHADPKARFARGAPATHVQVRDRSCIGPGCTRPARRSDLDHTIDHGHGGPTVPANIGPACRRHHTDKDRGWRLTQPEPGRFCWTSPLGNTYRTRGEPIRLDLPDPDPQPREDPGEQTAAEVDRRLRNYDPPLLQPPATNPPLPPPPEPEPPEDGDPPF